MGINQILTWMHSGRNSWCSNVDWKKHPWLKIPVAETGWNNGTSQKVRNWFHWTLGSHVCCTKISFSNVEKKTPQILVMIGSNYDTSQEAGISMTRLQQKWSYLCTWLDWSHWHHILGILKVARALCSLILYWDLLVKHRHTGIHISSICTASSPGTIKFWILAEEAVRVNWRESKYLYELTCLRVRLSDVTQLQSHN